jgi:REP element-mobilizing transposase RayT
MGAPTSFPHAGRMQREHAGHAALRKGRVSLENQAYLVTVVARKRRRPFADFDSACAACRVLGDRGAWRGARPLAWVLMPDHLHALLALGDEPLPRVMQSVNSRTARAANLANGAQGPVWQSAYHDHALRADEDLLVAARYLIANPVRAGLVARVGDYPYWDALWAVDAGDPMNLLLPW